MDLIKVDTFLQSTFRDNLDRGHPKGMEHERSREGWRSTREEKERSLRRELEVTPTSINNND